mgnify:CR=1 FL=1
MNKKDFRYLSTPYLIWLYALAVTPVIIMFVLMFLKTEGVTIDEETSLTLSNFSLLIEPSTVVAFYNSFKFGILTTITCIVLGYLVAYKIYRSHFGNKFLVLTVLILPMWSNMLLRTEALGNIMEPNNILADLLSRIGIDLYINIKGTDFAVLIGLVFNYLPFMILPIYTALEKIDPSLEEAALDLGLTEMNKFWKVVYPLSSKGIVTGSIMVFLPSLSGFAIPEILGKGNVFMLGNLIQQKFVQMEYFYGSILAIIILVLILGSLMILNKVDKEGETLL